MKSLKEYIYEVSLTEGLLDRVKNKEVNHKVLIEEFLEANYEIKGSYTIKETKKGFVVDIKGGVNVKNKNITSLTNGLFKFGTVSEHFYCDECKSLTSLEGAPQKVKLGFDCAKCKSLTSLKGAPQKVGWGFYCSDCDLLTSLEGAPQKVGWNFNCNDCDLLTSLKGAPEEVGDSFWCFGCKSLKSLDGAPKKVGLNFDCSNCGIQFTEDDVKKHTKVAKKIYV